jgi:Polyketide cyclase / dehydrase and lipid transport
MRMPLLSQKVERVLSFCGPEQLFDLAADVERYPEFQRWWIAARIRKWEGDSYYTDQVLGFGPIRVRFGSKTVLHRPERIDVTSDEPPFRRFALSWIFEPLPGDPRRRGGTPIRQASAAHGSSPADCGWRYDRGLRGARPRALRARGTERAGKSLVPWL